VHFRQDRKWKNETITEDTTFSESLPSSGILAAILLTVRIRNNGAHYDVVKQNIWDHLSKIVVKADGVENFKDVWGQTLLAEYAVQYGLLPPGFIDLMANNYQTLVFPILFGRHFKDPKFALDLSQYGETRLEITNDFATADLYATLNIWYDIDLWFLEDAPKPTHFLGASQISSKTWTGNSQEHTFKLPKKYPIRRIFLGCESFRSSVTGGQGNKAWRTLRYLKYSYKSGSIVLRDKDDLYRSDQDNLWGYPDLVEIAMNCSPRTGYTQDVGLCRPQIVVATPAFSSDPGADRSIVIDQRSERLQTWRRSSANEQARLYARGYGVMDHLCIHEDKPDDIEGYLDPEGKADVEVLVGNSSSGGSSGIIRFITEHLRANAT